MEMRKQGEGQGTARSASKAPVKKQTEGEQAGSTGQGASENQQASQPQANQPQANQPNAAAQSNAASNAANRGAEQDQRSSSQQGGEEGLLQHAKQAGGEIVNQVQQRAGSQVNDRKALAADGISNVANTVRRIRETISQQDNGAIARYAAEYSDMAANRLEEWSNYIREKDPKQLLDDVQNFGRRRPAVLLGGAFLLGFAGARLIKSSMNSTAPNAR